jgi:hypothetical protein
MRGTNGIKLVVFSLNILIKKSWKSIMGGMMVAKTIPSSARFIFHSLFLIKKLFSRQKARICA